MTAQMAPVSKSDPDEVYLEVEKGGIWEQEAEIIIVTPCYTAEFRVTYSDSTIDQPYRVKYIYRSSGNDEETVFWNGTVRYYPKENDEIVVAGFTGNHNIGHHGLSGTGG